MVGPNRSASLHRGSTRSGGRFAPACQTRGPRPELRKNRLSDSCSGISDGAIGNISSRCRQGRRRDFDCVGHDCLRLHRRSGTGLHRRCVPALRIGHSERRSHHRLHDPAASRTQSGVPRLLPDTRACRDAGDATNPQRAAASARQEAAQGAPQAASQVMTCREAIAACATSHPRIVESRSRRIATELCWLRRSAALPLISRALSLRQRRET